MDKNQNIYINKIDATHVELLSKVALKAYSDHYLHFWHDGGKWYMGKCFSVQALQKELKDENALFFIAYENDEALGYLKINIDAALEGQEEKNALELERIYLTKAATGKGVGGKIMQLVFKIAKEKHKDIIWLKVMDSSTGPIAFYKKMGFEICGTYNLDFTVMKEELRGMYVMKKVVK